MEEVKIYRNTASLKDVSLFYLDTKTDGPAILCLHGRWGRGETWYDFMRRYGKRCRVVAPDQRGHGLSAKPVSSYSAEEMAGDIVQLLDFLGIGPAVIVGHSMGGRVAGHLAALYPSRARALAILDKSANAPAKPFAPPPDEIPAVDPVTKGWPMPFPSRIAAAEFIKRATESELEYNYFLNSLAETPDGYRMLFSAQAVAANIASEKPWFDLLPRIACPVLLVRSGSHEAVPDEDFARMQSLLKNCTAREMSHPDHNVYLSDKEQFYGYFDGWLNNL